MKKQPEEHPNSNSEQPVLPKDFFKQFKSKEEFHSFFNDLFKQGVEEMLQAELDAYLGYEKYAREGQNSGNSRWAAPIPKR
jgi:putative transposase